MFARFSLVGGEKGSAHSERDPRGFALKFYTEYGNWDLVGNNTPVFFIKDPKKFSHFIHTQNRNPKTNCKNPTMVWDFFSLNPESLHQVLILMSDRGTPFSYRNMHGFGGHTFSLINKNIPVNQCPYAIDNYQRDGLMQISENGGSAPNYRPNSFDDIVVDKKYKEPAIQMDSLTAGGFDRNENDDDHYTQPGMLYRNAMNEQDRNNFAGNIISLMTGIEGRRKNEIINRQLCHFFRVDIQLGVAITNGLGIPVDEKMMKHKPKV